MGCLGLRSAPIAADPAVFGLNRVGGNGRKFSARHIFAPIAGGLDQHFVPIDDAQMVIDPEDGNSSCLEQFGELGGRWVGGCRLLSGLVLFRQRQRAALNWLSPLSRK